MSVNIDDCETTQASSETRPRARKPHRCDACHETIPTGTVYVRNGFVAEGTAETIKRCLRCERIYEHLAERFRAARRHGEAPDVLLDCGHTYRDEWDEDPPEEVAALAFALPGEVE
jgi:hypothetical protein